MQTTQVRLRGALLLAIVGGAVVLPALPAAAATSPTIQASAATCDLLGATDILVQVGGLEQGESYTVTVEVASTRDVINAQPLSGSMESVAFVFPDIPNGNTYAVSIANAANTLGATTSVELPICDLPTLPDGGGAVVDAPPAPPTIGDLAFTAQDAPLGAAVGGIALIQFGLVLIGVMILARRARGRTS